jgi:hypothetical protein
VLRTVAFLLLAGLIPSCAFAESELAIDDEKPAASVEQTEATAPVGGEPASASAEVVTEEAPGGAAPVADAAVADAGEEAVVEETPAVEPAVSTPTPVAAPVSTKAPAIAPQGAPGPQDGETAAISDEGAIVTEAAPTDAVPAAKAAEVAATPASAGAWAKADSQTKDAAKSIPAMEATLAEDTGETEIIEEAPAETVSDAKEGAPAGEETAVTASKTALPASAKKDKTPDVVAPIVEEVTAVQEETSETPSLADEPTIEAGPEESFRPVVETEPVPEAELAMPELETEPAPVFVWSAKAQERAFDDFLKAGFEMGTSASPVPVSLVMDTADGVHSLATLDDAVIIKGFFKRGQLLAAYHVSPGGCGAGYVGILAVVRTAGQATCRAVVKRITERISPGDLLLPLEEVRADFERQKRTAARGAGGEVTASVSCLSDERNSINGPNDIIQLDRGSADGVALGWLAQAQMPGKESELTYGRVVRVGRNSCFIRIAKIYQPLISGDPVRLSFAGSTGRASGSANPGTGKAGVARRPARPADALASKRR